jgi:hypothetical protein
MRRSGVYCLLCLLMLAVAARAATPGSSARTARARSHPQGGRTHRARPTRRKPRPTARRRHGHGRPRHHSRSKPGHHSRPKGRHHSRPRHHHPAGHPVAVKNPVPAAAPLTNCVSQLAACGYPAAGTNDGVPAGTALTPVSSARLPSGATWTGSELDISGGNVTISGLNIDGVVRITGAGDTLKDSFVNPGGSNGGAVLIASGASNALIEDSEIEAPGDTIGAIHNASNEPAEALRDYVHNECTGWLGLGTVKDSYIITDANVPGCHYEPVYVPGGNAGIMWGSGPSYTVVEHNTLLNPNNQTAAVFLDNHAFGPNANVLVDNNLVAGGDYPIYGDQSGDGSSNVVITDNRYSNAYYSVGGSYGACGGMGIPGSSHNYWDSSLATISC